MAIPMPKTTQLVITIGVKIENFLSAAFSSESAVGEEASPAGTTGTGAGRPEGCAMTDETGSWDEIGRLPARMSMADSAPIP